MNKYRGIFIAAYICIAITGFINNIAFNSIPRVSLVSVQREDIVKSIKCNGRIDAQQYGVFSSVSTDIEELYVSVGERVNENQKLLKTKPSDNAVAVMAGIESYQNELYNNYLSVFSQALSDLGLGSFSSGLSVAAMPEYDYVVQDSDIIYAPGDGVVTSINTGGKGVELGIEPIVVITDYSDVSVICKVSEGSVGSIEAGQSVKISGSGFEKSYDGKVEEISTSVNASLVSGGKSTVDVIIDILNPDDVLLDGLSASCKITTDIDKSSTVLPTSCIYQNEVGQEFVMVYENGYVKYKEVDCEYFSSEKAKIEGLNSDDLVIVHSELLPENSRILLNEVN